MTGRLTTHVLDTVRGRPAAGIPVTLHRDGELVARALTDADGRTGPLLEGDSLTPGVYELTFSVGDHFGETPGFLDQIPVRFTVREAGEHHHVPLLVSPWAYSTYRGS